MPWKQHFFKKNGSKEPVGKETYFEYYIQINVPVHYLIRDQQLADEIICHTILQVYNDSAEHTEADLFALLRRIAIGKCFEHIKNDPRLAEEHKEYLNNNEDSADLLEALFNCAQSSNNELIEWKQLSAAQQEKLILECTPPAQLHARFNKWSELLKKYRDRNITGAEEKEFLRQAATSRAKQAQYKQFATPEEIVKLLKHLNEIDIDGEYERFKKKLHVIRQPDVYYSRIMVAACLLYLVIAITHFTFHRTQSSPSHGRHPLSIYNWVPGTEPELILYNGTIVKLDSILDGVPVASGFPFKKNGSTLVYVPLMSGGQVQEQGFNILSIPPGRQFQITLADGSQISLNESSQLHFPVHFSENKRWVDMEGEAFFHVNADKAKPFIVRLKDSVIVTVLGTSFNIDARNKRNYTKTTLIEGILKITANRSGVSKLLRPGQQAHFANDKFLMNEIINIREVLAWKESWFYFKEKSIYDLMEEIGQWYNVKVQYGKVMPAVSYSGRFSRSLSLADIVKDVSSAFKIRIELKANTLIVSPL